MVYTFQTFRSNLFLEEVQAPQQVSVALKWLEGEFEAGSDSSLPMAGSSGEGDTLEVTATGISRFKLTLEEVDELLAAIYDTFEIKQEKIGLARHDLMYRTLVSKS